MRANVSIENGEFLVVMDDESRENEGDLMLPAQFATTEKFAFLVRHSRYALNTSSFKRKLTLWSGLVCLPITGERLDQLQIPLMVPKNTEPHRTAFTVSVDYSDGITPVISLYWEVRYDHWNLCPWSWFNSSKTCGSIGNRWPIIHPTRPYIPPEVSWRRCSRAWRSYGSFGWYIVYFNLED